MISRRAATVIAFFLTGWVGQSAHALSGLEQSFLGEPLVKDRPVQNVLEHRPVKDTTCKTPPTGPIETTLCDYELIESNNVELHSHLQELVKLPYFKYFRVDLYRDCPFWQENGSCMNRECGITSLDESEVPEKWRAAALSKIEQPPADLHTDLPGCYYRDSDFCFLDDMTSGEYYDLSLIPERFTGYAGLSTRRVWSAIYRENCFGLSELNLLSGKAPSVVTLPDTLTNAMREDGEEIDDAAQCLEKRVYYKIISGLHASISTHICMEYLDRSTGKWGPNLQCFIDRVATHPERLQYIYFNTVLMLRAVSRIGPYLSSYDYCSCTTPQHDDDEASHAHLDSVIDIAKRVGKFDETVLFRGENANVIKEEFKTHFRNVTRIMDCVGCDKCRLWGKVQTTGVATALKILFELDEKALDPKTNPNLLSRSEVVALINTLNRFSESLYGVDEFRRLWAKAEPEETEKLLSPTTSARFEKSQLSPPTSSDAPVDFFESLVSRFRLMTSRCERGAAVYLSMISGLYKRVLETLESILVPTRTLLNDEL